MAAAVGLHLDLGGHYEVLPDGQLGAQVDNPLYDWLPAPSDNGDNNKNIRRAGTDAAVFSSGNRNNINSGRPLPPLPEESRASMENTPTVFSGDTYHYDSFALLSSPSNVNTYNNSPSNPSFLIHYRCRRTGHRNIHRYSRHKNTRLIVILCFLPNVN